MRKHLITAAALMLAATATAASATTLLKIGGIFPDHGRDLGGYDSCPLDDGSTLNVLTFEAQGAREIRLEHRWPDGSLDAPAFTLAVGSLTDPQIACGAGGNAIVTWRRSDEWCIRYRVVDSDHRHASEVREAAPEGDCNIAPAFSVTDDGYAIAWLAQHPGARDDVWVQGYERDGVARYAPALLSTDPTHWHTWPAVGTDSDGNTVVAWQEGSDVFREMVAAAVTSDGEPSAVPLRIVDQATDAELIEGDPHKVLPQGPGIFSVYWSASVAGGLIGQRLAIAEVATQTTTTSTTTSTTLDDNQTPAFGSTRDLGLEEESRWSSIVPTLSSDGHGGWLAMWTGTAGATRRNREYFRLASVSNDSGRRWSRPLRQQGDPTTTLSDGNGEWIALGQDYVYGSQGWDNQILLSLSTGSGTAWLPPRKIAAVPEPDDDDCYAEVNAFTAGRSRSGVLAVVWVETTGCDFAETDWQSSDVYVIRSTDNGVSWTPPASVITQSYGDSIGGLHLVAVGSHGWLLVFGGNSYQVLRSVDDGASWGEPQPFAGDPAALVCDSADHCVLASSGVKKDFGWDGDIFADVSDDAGLTWTFAGPINSNALIDRTVDRVPVIATDDHGRWTAMWVSHNDLGGRIGLDADLLQASSTDGGRTWSPPRVVSELAATDGWLTDDEPRLGYGAGAWVALWETVAPTDVGYLKRRQARVIVADENCGDGVVAGFEECDDGNVADGDGCDRNCYATACGNGIQTAGEECDDGNDLDDDDCTSDCRVAVCGDGHVRAGVEECDDANSNDADACTNDCTAARCGDGIVAEGVEQCDDGNTSNEDACPNTCVTARCGDGYVEDGVEDCDDTNQDDGDGCRSDCSGARCGDANGDGEITATDSMGILLHAVGLPTPCPIQSCDIDGDFRIRSRDALMALGMSVGLSYPASCNLGPWLIVRLQDERAVAALELRADTSAAPLSFPVDGDGVPACQPFRGDVMMAAHVDGTELLLGMITRSELRGPADVARCRVEVTGEVHPSQFAVTIEDATDADGNPMSPPPVVVLRAAGD